jgi:hypothetical protein
VASVVADLIETSLRNVGSNFSEIERSDTKIEACGYAIGHIFCAYLDKLASDATRQDRAETL